MTTLLDANVLVALVVSDHVHHAAAENWLAETAEPFATCPITEGTLARLLIRQGHTMQSARDVLDDLSANPRHEFWPDSVSYTAVDIRGIIGHRQVTDAYLAQLARSRIGRLATFDRGLAELHRDIAELVPAS